jgi:hypothetical protein
MLPGPRLGGRAGSGGSAVPDVAYRIICAQHPPDHSVIARFRQVHEPALADLFEQALVVCARAGLGRFGRVALDGTKDRRERVDGSQP